ncbi:class I SAM-dependent methyltransferase [Aestuariimicrobium sp. p3-SID1156]|uniref:class I SAM-dependent methyltransferase n=1 Tax=Aestuariimicrobium sp. p3-SID1156 TaxID=2916038 RepID=UPI00223AA16D|nr:class I SAM-dependent methyltransferase [Aestuariimicrobium sp. p3-SID1156]MCT1458455.1 class I SAM-dependent methyltransferase [Aestuariimicrobium sp. p3-SID1156]
MPSWMEPPAWLEYLDRFHGERPGVAAEVLGRCLAGGDSPHTWLARAVSSSSGRVIDIGCGAGPMSRTLACEGRTVIGIDLSMQELREATRLGPGPWVRGDALQLPIADESVDVVVSSMALAVIEQTGRLLDEVCRVLRPGGMFAATVPTYRPINVTDMKLLSRLTARLGGPPRFPVRLDMSLGPLLLAHGLRKVEDARERYYFTIRSRADAELLLRALYLPMTSTTRVQQATDWLVAQVARGGELQVPIPIRRVVAVK